jgi:hypothetical protein
MFNESLNMFHNTENEICMTPSKFEETFRSFCNQSNTRPIIYIFMALLLSLGEPHFLSFINKLIAEKGQYIYKNKYVNIKYEDLYLGYRVLRIGLLAVAILLSYMGTSAYVGE